MYAYNHKQGQIFQESDKLVSKGRNDQPYSLRHDNFLHILSFGHTQGTGSFYLTPVNGFDTCTRDPCIISSAVNAAHGNTCKNQIDPERFPRDPDNKARYSVVKKKDLD